MSGFNATPSSASGRSLGSREGTLDKSAVVTKKPDRLASPSLLCLRPKPRVAGGTHAPRCVGPTSESRLVPFNGDEDRSLLRVTLCFEESRNVPYSFFRPGGQLSSAGVPARQFAPARHDGTQNNTRKNDFTIGFDGPQKRTEKY